MPHFETQCQNSQQKLQPNRRKVEKRYCSCTASRAVETRTEMPRRRTQEHQRHSDPQGRRLLHSATREWRVLGFGRGRQSCRAGSNSVRNTTLHNQGGGCDDLHHVLRIAFGRNKDSIDRTRIRGVTRREPVRALRAAQTAKREGTVGRRAHHREHPAVQHHGVERSHHVHLSMPRNPPTSSGQP